jgi:hypothetical protein
VQGGKGVSNNGYGYGYGRGFHLENIWEVRRGDEDASYKAFDAVGNRRLLWHGTNVAVVAAILKTGLRIMPSVNGAYSKSFTRHWMRLICAVSFVST